jgi:NTP pyrophosphatase (non-canonical NTP hydrolase)
MTVTIKELTHEAHKNSAAHGWWDGEDETDPVIVSSKIALMHSELSEALEEVRNGKFETYFNAESKRPNKPEGLPAELADTVIRIMDLCGALNIDLEKEILRKMEYNLSRSHKHGGKAI